MSQRKVFVLGTVQPGLNANFRKSGYCGTMSTPQETKAVLDMLEKERWALPFNHMFYREGIDEADPGDLKMKGEDVGAEFFGGVLTEKGDTVMVAELDPEHPEGKTFMADLDAYNAKVKEALAKGVPQSDVEPFHWGFSPQAKYKFSADDAVTEKDFQNISLVSNPEYADEGSRVHAVSVEKEDILRYLATNFVSKDGYVSPNFGATLWSYRSDSRPSSSYTPKILLPMEEGEAEAEVDDPMDIVTDDAPAPVPDDVSEKVPTPAEEQVQPPQEEEPAPERPGSPTETPPIQVFSSHGKSDPSDTTESSKAKPSDQQPVSSAKPAASQASVSPAPENTPSMSQTDAKPAESVEPRAPVEPVASENSAADESADVEMKNQSLPPEENQEQQRAKAAEAAEDFFKRAQHRNREMTSIQADSDKLAGDAAALLKEMGSNSSLIDFTQVASLLKRYQEIDAKIDELNLGRKEVPRSYTIATAKANDVLTQWNTSMKSAAEKHDMKDDLPKNMEGMMDDPQVLQANQQILKVFSKSLGRTSADSSMDAGRVNQRTIEARAEEVRKKKLEERKRPRDEEDRYVKQPTTPMDEKKRKVNEGLVELPRSRIVGTFNSQIMAASIYSSRYNRNRDHERRPEKTAVTKTEEEIRARWIRLAASTLIV